MKLEKITGYTSNNESFEEKNSDSPESSKVEIATNEDMLSNQESQEKNKKEIKNFEEGMKKISELVFDLKKAIPSTEYLVDIYSRSLSTDHYHAERSAEASILMMLKSQTNLIADELSKYKNFSDPDGGLAKSSTCPSEQSIENLKNILNINTGTSRAKFFDADNFKLSFLINELKNTVIETEAFYKE
jgi:hypothetical protein